MAKFNEKVLYEKALLCYQTNGKHLCYDEFKVEISRLVTFGKMLKQQKNKGNYNIRMLLNSIIIAYNVFGLSATSFLVAVCHETVYPELMAIFKFLYTYPTSGVIMSISDEAIFLDYYTPNLEFKQLLEKETS